MVIGAMTIIALAAGLLIAGAEWLHARRVARVARLAFGESAKPRVWARLAPVARIAGVTLATWGALVLFNLDPQAPGQSLSPRANQQLLVCLDVSPSMLIEDAGPPGSKMTRAKWAGKLVQGILERVSDEDTRYSLIAFYTDALPMLQTSNDKNVLFNMLDGLPVYVAFEPGPTKIDAGIREAANMCKAWGRKSTTLIIITDGDVNSTAASSNLPASIADVLVLGVGDPARATMVAGHSSRQDAMSLRSLAAKLRGTYLESNQRHVPSTVMQSLSMAMPTIGTSIGLRSAGLIALVTGTSLLAFITPMLLLFGLPRTAPLRQLPSPDATVDVPVMRPALASSSGELS